MSSLNIASGPTPREAAQFPQFDNAKALRTIMGLYLAELHFMAQSELRKESVSSITPTDLMNEACLRLLMSNTRCKNTAYFLGAAANAMRRILVERARRRLSLKRGGQFDKVAFDDDNDLGLQEPQLLLDLEMALRRLLAINPLLGKTAELRLFGGLSTTEIAPIIKRSQSSARRIWKAAREYLARELKGEHRGDR